MDLYYIVPVIVLLVLIFTITSFRKKNQNVNTEITQ